MNGLTANNRQRLKLVALIALFVGPLLAAWAMLEWQIGIPDERTAHGRLLPSLPPFEEWPLAESELPIESGDWILAYDCHNDCSVAADRWWRLHRALGRESPRLTRLRIDTESAVLPGEVAVDWQARPDWSDEESLWFIDPEGRVVLSYRANHDADEVLEDIRRLLRMNP